MLYIVLENSIFGAIWDHFVLFQVTQKFRKLKFGAYLSDFNKNNITKKHI